MRKLSAHLICDGRGKCYAKGIVTLDGDGTVLDIEDTRGNLEEMAGVEFYSGVLVPGFVNAHCHLELSHLAGSFPEKLGMVAFLKKVVQDRNDDPDQILQAAEKADWQMVKNGIVAVGDVANGPTAFEVKRASKIDYFTFVEALGFAPARAPKAMEWARSCVATAESLGLRASIVPHAPYSVSVPLFEAIAAEAEQKGSLLSIHNQECVEEDELYRSGSGGMVAHLRNHLGIDTSFFNPTGESAMRSTLALLPTRQRLLLVHNVQTTQADLDYIGAVRGWQKTWLVLCPGSNLYIQDRLPDVELFRQNRLPICLGTDSLSSNRQLSILEEMKLIQTAFPTVPLEELVTWATGNGAGALGIDSWAGTIEVGKRPGINLLTGLDITEKKLLPGTGVKKIV